MAEAASAFIGTPERKGLSIGIIRGQADTGRGGREAVLFIGEFTIAEKPASFFQEYAEKTAGNVRIAKSSEELEQLLKKMISWRY